MPNQSPQKMRLAAAGKDAKRVMEGEQVVAMVLALANGKWILCDTNEKRIDSRAFDQPKDALAALKAIRNSSAP